MKKTPNAQQQAVIDQLDNNILLFASAGTGKTFTVAKRVANILAKKKAKNEEILCLTFTIKACNELKEDISAYVDGDIGGVQVNTIHGFCYKLIVEESKRMGTHGNVGICDEVDQEELLRSLLSARYAYWCLERTCAEAGITPPDLDSCELCTPQGAEGFFWRMGNKLIDCTGALFDVSKDKEYVPAEILCPDCQRLTRLQDKKCAYCEREISFSLLPKKFEIYHKKTALRNLISEIKHQREAQDFHCEDEAEAYQHAFDYIKNEMPSRYEELTSYYARYLGYAPDEEFAAAMQMFAGRLTKEYDEHLRLSGFLDFDDLIIKANSILKANDGGMYWTNVYKYLILDEMQDTSRLEYSLLKKLFYNSNVMLCGDFFQTIYGWRGSRPEEILEDYQKEFSPKTYTLSENYRATKTLSNASFGFLQKSCLKLLEKYCPDRLQIHSEEEGEKIFCYAFDNREQEAWQIYKFILRNKSETAGNICVIARSNKYIARLSEYFRRFDVERKEKDGLRFFTVEENFQFFKKPVVKDVLAVYKLLLNPFDRVSMERLTEKFVRQVGIKSIETLRNFWNIGVSITNFINEQTYLYDDPYAQLLDGYRQGNIVIYDTETTGLDLSKDEIIQISAIKIDTAGVAVDTLDLLVVPTVPISEEAQKTHGFTLACIQENDGISAKEALSIFSDFVRDCVLVGHNNLGYDKPLIARQLLENGLPALAVRAEYDTLSLAKQFYPTLKNYKLSTLCQQFSVVNECAHNALGDIQATGKCLVRILKEKVLPTAMERRIVLAKYKDKFEKFFTFMQELQLRFEKAEPLAPFIIESLRLEKRYTSYHDRTALQDLSDGLETPAQDRGQFLREYLKDAALSGSQLDALAGRLNRIPIITVHQAKGCEFDTVILAGADDSNFPSFAAQQSGGEEEEKKVFYVAITRAKQRLIMTRALQDGRQELGETPYFWAIPQKYIRMNRVWKNGD